MAGFALLLLGGIGLLLPVWPTTPFVICAAGCFTGSPRIRAAMLNIHFFREHIENYQNRSGLSRKTLVRSLLFLWGMLLFSIWKMEALWVTVLLPLVGLAVTLHLWHIAHWKPKAAPEASAPPDCPRNK
ncbi:MAG: YbaN family protein [Oscillibacter sp.]